MDINISSEQASSIGLSIWPQMLVPYLQPNPQVIYQTNEEEKKKTNQVYYLCQVVLMWKTSQNREVRDCALSKWQKHYEHKSYHVRSLTYPYSLWHLLLTAVIFILIRSDTIIFLACFSKSIFKKLCHLQNPEWYLLWSHLKSTKLWSCHLLILMSKTVKCHSESGRSLHEYGKRGRRAAESERIIFLYWIKNEKKNHDHFNCFHSFLLFHLT